MPEASNSPDAFLSLVRRRAALFESLSNARTRPTTTPLYAQLHRDTESLAHRIQEWICDLLDWSTIQERGQRRYIATHRLWEVGPGTRDIAKWLRGFIKREDERERLTR
ncbi:MAG: hypothetical protein Q9225_000332 [Loekoesia sp. 1 TL-2023]